MYAIKLPPPSSAIIDAAYTKHIINCLFNIKIKRKYIALHLIQIYVLLHTNLYRQYTIVKITCQFYSFDKKKQEATAYAVTSN